MTADLQRLKLIGEADVYKAGVLAGHLSRTAKGGVSFAYREDYLATGWQAVAFSLPLSMSTLETGSGALPTFFAGLLPEGHRLTILKNAAKTSFDDELTLLLAVGNDLPGDVQVVPAGEGAAEPESIADASRAEELDFAVLAGIVDRHGLPGVQNKVSASMLTVPLALRGARYLLKLDGAEAPHLVLNEAAHLVGAKALKLPVAQHRVIRDMNELAGLLVTRFDRVRADGGGWQRLPLEDGAQVLDIPPAAKYSVSSEQVCEALAMHCQAPVIARRNIYLQFIFAWLTGNGDLHAKNLSILGTAEGVFQMAPIYDIPCTLLYGDDTLALTVAGRSKNLKARHWAEFADSLGLPPRAVAAANKLALNAASNISLENLPFSGSPLRSAQRELRFRRSEISS